VSELRAHCGVAFVASAVAAADLSPVLPKEHGQVQLASAPDAWLVLPAVDPVLSKFSGILRVICVYRQNAQHWAEPRHHTQFSP
jgi:hypothetical protein